VKHDLSRSNELKGTLVKIIDTVVGVLGTGGRMPEFCDHLYAVPTDIWAHMQEGHLAAIHILCEVLDDQFGGNA